MNLLPITFFAVLAAPLFVAGQDTMAKRPLPIIDMHQHAKNGAVRLPNGKFMPAPGVAGAPTRPPPIYTDAAGMLQGTLERMNKHNIVLGYLDGKLGADWANAAPGRFLLSAGINKGNEGFGAADGVEKLRAELVANRFRGIGEIGTQYQGLAPNDPWLAPYFALAEEFDLPVLLHMGGGGMPGPRFRSAAGRPTLLEDVLVKHPKLRVYLENASYPYLDEVIAIMTQYPNVHADLSTITWVIGRPAFHRYLKALVEAGLGDRLMFGSDQMSWPEAIDWAVEGIESADFLTAQQKRDIFYNNAARFLRLSEAEIAQHHGRR